MRTHYLTLTMHLNRLILLSYPTAKPARNRGIQALVRVVAKVARWYQITEKEARKHACTADD